MKRTLSIILTFVLLCFCVVPCAYAEEVVDEGMSADEELFEDLLEEDLSNELLTDEAASGELPEGVAGDGSDIAEPEEPAEQPEEPELAAVYKKELEVLQALGIMDVDDPVATITRAEFVSYVAILCGYAGETAAADGIFSDVYSGHLYESEIAYAAGIKLVQGDGTNFRPDEPILVEEAGFILLRALGYDKFSPYITIDMVKAKQEGIFEGISENGKHPMTFDTAAKAIYNAMNLEMILVQGTTSDGLGTAMKLEKDGTTLLNYYLKIYMVEGVVTDNGFTTFSGETEVSDTCIKIDDDVYMKGDTAPEELLGHEVEAYCTDDDELLYICDITKERNILFIPAEDIISASMGSVSYETENGRVRTAAFLTNANIVYNGKALKLGEYKSELLKPQMGGIKLIRTSGKDYDLLVITSQYNCVVSRKYNKDGVYTFTDVDSSDKNVKFDIDDVGASVTVRDSEGNDVSCESIETHNVLTVAESLDGKLLNIAVSTEVVYATITGLTTGDKTKIIADGAEYIMTHDADTTYVEMNAYGQLYFDIYGNVAYFKSYEMYQKRFAYLLGIKLVEDEFPGVMIKVFDPLGKVLTFTAPERLIVDGATVKERGFAALAESFYDGDEFNPCLIRYELNLDGTLKSIDTPTRTGDEGEDTLRQITPREKEYSENNAFYGMRRFTSSWAFDGQLFTDNKTVVFAVPRGPHSDEDYLILTRSYFIANRYYDVETYTTDGDSDIAEIAVVKYSPKYDEANMTDKNYILLPSLMSTNMNTGFVKDIQQVVDANGDVVYQAEILDLKAGASAVYTVRWEELADVLTKGDVVRYFALNNKVIDAEKVFDTQTRTPGTPRVYYKHPSSTANNINTFVSLKNGRVLTDNVVRDNAAADLTAAWRLAYFDVLAVQDRMLLCVPGDAESGWAEEDIERVFTEIVNNIYKYNERTEAITEASFSDIYGYETANDSSKILVMFSSGRPNAIVILE